MLSQRSIKRSAAAGEVGYGVTFGLIVALSTALRGEVGNSVKEHVETAELGRFIYDRLRTGIGDRLHRNPHIAAAALRIPRRLMSSDTMRTSAKVARSAYPIR